MTAATQSTKTVVIVNPAARGGWPRRKWPVLEPTLRGELGAIDIRFTTRVGEGRVLAREAARRGAELVVALGGDGTVSEVAAGLLGAAEEQGSEEAPCALGYLPCATGGDLRRTLGCPEELAEAARRIAAGRERTLDAGRIEQLNDERKAVERAVTEQAVAQARDVYGDHPTSGIVVAQRGWHRGVVGISAARLVERFGVPAVVIAVDEQGVGHGSGRTPEGYHLHAAFSACRGDLLKFGGHAMAAGLSLNEGRLDALRAGFAAATPRQDNALPLPLVDVEVGDTFALPSAADLLGLEPLGEGNEAPVFALQARVLDARAVGDGQHLKLTLRAGGEKLTAFQRDAGPSADSVSPELVAVGTLSPDHYRGGGALELSIDALIDP